MFSIEKIKHENFRNKIRLRWRYNYKNFVLSLGWDYNEENILKAQLKKIEIFNDIVSDKFDFTLEKYKPLKVKSVIITKKSFIKSSEELIKYFEKWVEEIGQDLINNANYFSILYLLRNWSNIPFKDYPKKLKERNISITTYNRRLSVLKQFFDSLYKKGLLFENPFKNEEKIKEPKRINKDKKLERKPFSDQELFLFLEAIRTDRFSEGNVKHSYYYPFFYFLFRTGLRNQEIIGLPIKNLDFDNSIIIIDRALARIQGKAYRREVKSTKTGLNRLLPFTEDLKEITKPIIKDRDPEDLVFTTPKGKPINDQNLARRIIYPVLEKLNIPKRNMYAARHSFGSRCINLGLNIMETAYLMGNNPKTIFKHYAWLMQKVNTLPPIFNNLLKTK